MSEQDSRPEKEQLAEMAKLLKEAVKIIHCHERNLHKDWLSRARETLRKCAEQRTAQTVVSLIGKLRVAVADYIHSEGCGCCSNAEAHKKHKAQLAELLGIPPHEDGSGYDFGRYISRGRKP